MVLDHFTWWGMGSRWFQKTTQPADFYVVGSQIHAYPRVRLVLIWRAHTNYACAYNIVFLLIGVHS